MLIVEIIESNTMYSVHEMHLWIFSRELHSVELHSVKVISTIFASSTFLVHSLTNLLTNFFLHLLSSQSKYSPTSHDLSHSHWQLLGFQIDPLSHITLSINSLHSHLHLSSFQRCYYYKRLHLIYIYTYTFHAILCVLFHQFLTLD